MITIEAYQPKKHTIEEAFTSYCQDGNALYLALCGGKVIGGIGFNVSSGEILHLKVDSTYRRKGVGRLLLQSIHKRILSPMLKVKADKESVGFFMSCGFSCDENFYCYHVVAGRGCC